jgi:hypothetical protein
MRNKEHVYFDKITFLEIILSIGIINRPTYLIIIDFCCKHIPRIQIS